MDNLLWADWRAKSLTQYQQLANLLNRQISVIQTQSSTNESNMDSILASVKAGRCSPSSNSIQTTLSQSIAPANYVCTLHCKNNLASFVSWQRRKWLLLSNSITQIKFTPKQLRTTLPESNRERTSGKVKVKSDYVKQTDRWWQSPKLFHYSYCHSSRFNEFRDNHKIVFLWRKFLFSAKTSVDALTHINAMMKIPIQFESNLVITLEVGLRLQYQKGASQIHSQASIGHKTLFSSSLLLIFIQETSSEAWCTSYLRLESFSSAKDYDSCSLLSNQRFDSLEDMEGLEYFPALDFDICDPPQRWKQSWHARIGSPTIRDNLLEKSSGLEVSIGLQKSYTET